jgi:putative transposase
MVNKAYKIRLYPTKKQSTLMDKTFGCVRFIFNKMLDEKTSVYELLKNDKKKLYSHKYKTEKEYKVEFPWLSEVSSYALQQSRQDLENAYRNFFNSLKKRGKVGFPKFKSRKDKLSYKEPQNNLNKKTPMIYIKDKKIKLPKMGFIKFRGLSENFKGEIKSVTVTKEKTGFYYASILVEQDQVIRIRKSNGIIGLDYGLKELITTSNGEHIKGIKDHLKNIEAKIIKQQKHLSRKQKGSNRKEKCRVKLAKLNAYKTNFQNHFFWNLANKLCNENQVIGIENLNIAGMLKNRKLSKAIYKTSWSSFVLKLEQKAKEYGTIVYKIDRFFPSSKTCSCCGAIKEDLTLADRVYKCDCGNEIDRDINAAINIKNLLIDKLSLEYNDYKRGEKVRPKDLFYKSDGIFCEAFT